MAGKSNTSATFFAQKKLLGKAHTSNLKVDGEELIGSNIQASFSQVFGQPIPNSPAQTLWLLQSSSNGAPATVEYIQFALTVITGTTYDADASGGGAGSDAGESSQSSGPHTYRFELPSSYTSNSSNPKEGKGVFDNGRILHETLGKVQLIPPFFSQTSPNPYVVKIFKDNGSGGVGDEIPLLDNIDWNVDYYNGVLFLQDYSSTKIPAHAKAFAYIGEYADKGFFESGLSGSLTQLSDGKSYLVAGTNITVASASNGQVTISASGGGSDTQNTLDQAYDEGAAGQGAIITVDKQPLQLKVAGATSTALAITGSVIIGSGSNGLLPGFPGNDANFFVSGALGSRGTAAKGTSVFGGDLFTSGTVYANSGLTGSLTNLADGTSYLVAGSNITITSGSKGQITLASTNTTYTAGDGLDLSGTEFALDLKSGSGLVIASTELDINDSIIATISGSGFKGHVGVTGSLYSTTTISGSLLKGNYLTGSLTKLTDGKSYLVAGSNVTITSGSTGQVTIASTDTNTTYTAGDGLDLSTTTFSLDLKSGGGLKIDSTELSIEPNDFAGTGLMDDGSDNLKINDSIVATISGSGFKGHVGVTGSLHSTSTISGSLLKGSYLSGSLTKLTDGKSYLVAGSNITITSGSNGQVTIASADANTTYTAGDGLDLSGTEFALDLKSGSGLVITSTELDINDSIVATISGSGFKGHVGVTGSLYSTTTISGSLLKGNYLTGSLTKLANGTSYLVAGSNVTITSGSKGQVTIASADTDTTYTAGDGLDLSTTTFSLDLKSGGGLKIDSTELSIEPNDFAGTGLMDDGSDNLKINDSIVATISGSGFKGHVGVTGSLYSTTTISGSLLKGSYLSGSLTKLTDGKSYLVAGSNIAIASSSNGQVTITSTDTDTTYTAGNGLDLSGTEFALDLKSGSGLVITSTELDINDSIIATISGSGFKGHVGVTGSLYSTTTISGSLLKANYLTGSLTKLTDGKSYLVAGSNVTIASSSNGQVTISAASAGTPAGSDTQIQYNDNGSFGASSAFKFDETDVVLYAESPTFTLRRTNNDQNSDLRFKGAAGVIGAQLTYSGSSSNDLVLSTFNGSSLTERVRIGSGLSNIAVEVTGSLISSLGLSGSLTKLKDGTSYIKQSGNTTITSQSNGAITISTPSYIFNEYVGMANGTNTLFTLDKTPTANKDVAIYVNGQLQLPATSITGAPFQDYAITGSIIYFTSSSLPDERSLILANYTTNDSTT